MDFFINQANIELDKKVMEISDEVKGIFEKYDWPGNIRELKNIIKRMVLLTNGSVAELSSLPDYMIYSIKNKDLNQVEGGDDLKSQSEAHERKLILEVLEKVKYNKSKEDIERLSIIQLDILNSVAPLLKKGGLLIYSTCTVDIDENEKVIKSFLDGQTSYEVDQRFFQSLPTILRKSEGISDVGLQLFPQTHQTDGFFISRLIKK